MQHRLRGVSQPAELRGAAGKTIEFTHLVTQDQLMIYFTDGTYLLVSGTYGLGYEYVED